MERTAGGFVAVVQYQLVGFVCCCTSVTLSMLFKGPGDAPLNFLFWLHRQWFSHASCICYCKAVFYRKCTHQFIIRARQEEAMKHTVFPNLMFACMVGRIFSSSSTQVSLVWLILLYRIWWVSLQIVTPLASLFSTKWWLKNLRWWHQNAEEHWPKSNDVEFLFYGHSPLPSL